MIRNVERKLIWAPAGQVKKVFTGEQRDNCFKCYREVKSNGNGEMTIRFTHIEVTVELDEHLGYR